ncbi:hypothetical protein ACFZAO_05540 [Streptomyces griseoaurantiacus]|uniref:hypothetical protein n=1 Tax=Streptomyces griseoaurantiacus TaxID=68213 RepID=UPI0036EF40E5
MNIEGTMTDTRAAEQAHRDYLANRLAGIDDPEERVNEIMDQHARYDDPANCTDEDRARAFGPNWREVTAVIQQAASLTVEQAERIASCSMAEWELDNLMEEAGLSEDGEAAPGSALQVWDTVIEVGDEALETKYEQHEAFWETRFAYLAALMAAVAGDEIPETLRSSMTRAWSSR